MSRVMRTGLIFSVVAGLLAGCQGPVGDQDFDLVVFQTNDRHSHFLGLPNVDYRPQTTGDGTVGGMARWVRLVEQERETNPDVLLLSAGDFTMGTLLVAAEGTAADLNTMKDLGYQAAALGNHEFDWGPDALADMILAAKAPPVPLLCANIEFSDSDPADDRLAELYGQPGEPGKFIFPYQVLETASGARVGIFGLMGLNAAEVSNAKPVRFSDDMDEMAETAQAMVDRLRNQEQVDLVLLLAHLGIRPEEGDRLSETLELARRVEGIDVILSGHEHSVTEQAVRVPGQVADGSWTTVTMEAGSYGKNLGRYEIHRTGDVLSIDGEVIPVDDSLPGDQQVSARVQEMIADVEQNLLPLFRRTGERISFPDGSFFQELARSDFDLIRHNHENNNLAYLLADAMREEAGTQLAAVSNGGDVRGSLQRVGDGLFDLADTFMVTPLGIGPDKLLGYPLVRAHLYLSEIRIALESTTCDWGLQSNDYMINLSGLKIVFDSTQPLYNRITRMTLYSNLDESDPGTVLYDADNGGYQVNQYETLLSICVSSYIAGLFSAVGMFPRDEDGNQVIGDLSPLLVRDQSGRESKLWYVFARKLLRFQDAANKGGVAPDHQVPDQYNDDPQRNPLGPHWRRAWDLARHSR